jgi:hypothetical protein
LACTTGSACRRPLLHWDSRLEMGHRNDGGALIKKKSRKANIAETDFWYKIVNNLRRTFLTDTYKRRLVNDASRAPSSQLPQPSQAVVQTRYLIEGGQLLAAVKDLIRILCRAPKCRTRPAMYPSSGARCSPDTRIRWSSSAHACS